MNIAELADMREIIRQHLPIIICSASGLGALISAVLIDATGPSHIVATFSGADKVMHFFVFGLIAYFCAVLMHESGLSDPLFLPFQTLVFVGIIGLLTEMIQLQTPSRTADIYDLFADMAGAVVFLILWHSMKKRSQAQQYLEH